ncbi:hypothetical protein FOA52_006409 [Chlamydomonas sp. UWO 241]|nr:hypothetical protein FOA52_006409 [Chlamydomonas sp. UWO 241]
MPNTKNPVFVVLVTGRLKPGHRATFIQNFRPLAEFVAANEPGTLTYQLSIGTDDPDRICIYERYISKDYCETVHWASAEFRAFGTANREAGLEWESKEVVKMFQTSVGFMSR